MRREVSVTNIVLMSLIAVTSCTRECIARQKIVVEASAGEVGKYQKLELLIQVDARYEKPFDPDEVDLAILLETPNGEKIVLPAFFCQDYERGTLDQGGGRAISPPARGANWYYPIGDGRWKARFAPMQIGTYFARARLIDRNGTIQSDVVRFECTPSAKKGFLRAGRNDPRFLEFSEGAPFFAIGQNLAFIGEGQYVTLSKAEQIFATLSRNGANFLRIWTCCEDWAMAIEARKSAWDRSWHRRPALSAVEGTDIVASVSGSENDGSRRKCIKIEGGDGTSITVEPSHPVGLKPGTRYVLIGQFKAEGPVALRVGVGRDDAQPRFKAAPEGQWQKFRRELTTGENDFWLGRIVLSLAGSGTVWLDNLSLKEASGGAELLWEADINRPIRGFYNQIDCFMLDQLVESAEQNGIYLMLCLITRDLYMNSLSDDKSAEYQKAIDDAQKLLRYAVARWGYSTSVAAWEYFNEMDPGKPTDRCYAELGEYLEQIDIYRHLRTTSTWHPSARDCRHPRLDIGQLHHYMRPETKEEFKDEVAVVIDKTRFLREHAPNKPALIGEFGLATPKWGLSEYMKQDSGGVHFHNCLWASAFAGASGTAMFWWWDQLDRQDAYYHYQPLSTFLADVSFAGLQQLRAKVSPEEIRLLGYQGNDRAYMWLFNPQATWWNLVVEKRQPVEIKDATIEIQGILPGNYRLEWWDTYKGVVIEKKPLSFGEGPLHIAVPPFSRDIACKISQEPQRLVPSTGSG
jgi:tetratricopeptide (TPR) repeat protein